MPLKLHVTFSMTSLLELNVFTSEILMRCCHKITPTKSDVTKTLRLMRQCRITPTSVNTTMQGRNCSFDYHFYGFLIGKMWTKQLNVTLRRSYSVDEFAVLYVYLI